MNVQTFDLKTASLYGDLEEEIYMEISKGYENNGKIPSRWNKKLTNFLMQESLNQLKTDQCIFKNNTNSLFIAIHVYDGIGENERQIKEILAKLENQFQITKITSPKVYLGMEIERKPDGIHISQAMLAKCWRNATCKRVEK
jgi:hypothetical protein